MKNNLGTVENPIKYNISHLTGFSYEEVVGERGKLLYKGQLVMQGEAVYALLKQHEEAVYRLGEKVTQLEAQNKALSEDLRHKFAAAAMQGALACPREFKFQGESVNYGESEVARLAYAYADAMVTEAAKQPTQE